MSNLTSLRWHKKLFAPVDLSPLVYFRMAFGAIMLWEVWRYFNHGWIERYYIEPDFYFKYYGFSWVKPWPDEYMYLHFFILGVLAFCIMVGLWYRIAATLFFVGFSYWFLLDMTQYLNHFYLICLVSFIMIFIPAHRMYALDAYWRPHIRSVSSPAWALWALRLQLGVAYFYGGIAKINADWLRGEPMRLWLSDRTDFPMIGMLFTEEWVVYAFSYSGLLLDLLIVPFLMWKRTYLYACFVGVMFHLMNAELFSIGIFPWFMIAATFVLFYPFAWPDAGKLWTRGAKRLRWKPEVPLKAGERVILVAFCVFVIFQCLMPLRHLLYPGNVSWTEEGHNFSWHMKLRDKASRSMFYVKDTMDQMWEVDPEDFLTRRQANKMASRPDMILQFAHFLVADFRKEGYEDVAIYAEAEASLNGRDYQWIIDPDINLATRSHSLMPAAWIVPLTEPLLGPGAGEE
jgi:vitamin K-dependent gamma-carboxylase